MQTILTLDVGTTAVKTCLFTADLEIIARHSAEYSLRTGAGNIVEIDPEIYWESAREGIRTVLARAKQPPASIAAIGVTSQGETLIPVDADGRPLHDAIVWLDTRAGAEADALRARVSGAQYYRVTGIPVIDAANPICKLMWLKQRRPDIWKKTHAVLLVESHLIYRLTGKIVAEASVSSTSGWLDTETGDMATALLAQADIEPEKLPAVQKCGTLAGHVSRGAAEATGLCAGTQVYLTAMDQICAAIGAGNIRPGQLSETNGTALALTLTIGSFADGLKTGYPVVRHANGAYAVMPHCPTGGMVLKWYKDMFCGPEIQAAAARGISPYAMLDEMARVGKAAESGLFLIPHFAGKITPQTCAGMRGVLAGLGLHTQKQDVALAILESIAFILRENVESMLSMGLPVDQLLSIGGGARSALWQQIKADVLGRPIAALAESEATSVGAATLCAVACGYYPSLETACKGIRQVTVTYTPDAERAKLYDPLYAEFLRLDLAMRGFYAQ